MGESEMLMLRILLMDVCIIFATALSIFLFCLFFNWILIGIDKMNVIIRTDKMNVIIRTDKMNVIKGLKFIFSKLLRVLAYTPWCILLGGIIYGLCTNFGQTLGILLVCGFWVIIFWICAGMGSNSSISDDSVHTGIGPGPGPG